MAHVYLPSINREYYWDVEDDGSPPPWGTPKLQIPWAPGHDAFVAGDWWVDEALGGKGTGAAGSFTIAVYPGFGPNKTDLLGLQCKSTDKKRWQIVVDVDGKVVNNWGAGSGTFQIP